MDSEDRTYDIVIWGATGFTGRLIAEHFARHYQGDLQWAVGGRNAGKLEELVLSLTALNPECKGTPILIADLAEQKSVDEMVKSTSVIISAAGPFKLVGTPVVDACVRLGTHYCDTTGEVVWVRNIVKKYHNLAAKKGVKIVPMCGYESIPSDLGTLMVVDHMRDKLNRSAASVTTLIAPSKGFVSGGTIQSLLTALKAPEEERKSGEDPYTLNPPCTRRWPDTRYRFDVDYNPETQKHTSPWVMALSNGPVVRRSDAMLGYGDRFSYNEVLYHNTVKEAHAAKRSIVGSIAALETAPTRAVIRPFLPKPGQGPTPEQMQDAPWHHIVVGKTQEAAGARSQQVLAYVGGKYDHSYWSTSLMALEAGVCLATQGKELHEACKPAGGVLTPAVAMGQTLISRLRNRGIYFFVKEAT